MIKQQLYNATYFYCGVGDVLKLLRSYGCTFHMGCICAFAANQVEVVFWKLAPRMLSIGLSVSVDPSDVILPIVCEFSEGLVVARVSVSYITMDDSARISWL